MSEPCSHSRGIAHSEFGFVAKVLEIFAVSRRYVVTDLLVFVGRERTIIKTRSEAPKKKLGSFYFNDLSDDEKVFVDLLVEKNANDFEIWLWKPLKGGDFIAIPGAGEILPHALNIVSGS